MKHTNKLLTRLGIYLVQSRPHPCVYFYRMTCLWGIFLLLPFNTFNNAGYAVMRQYAPENVWGFLILFVGLRLRQAALSKDIRKIRDALFGTLIIWVFITVMICSSGTFGTGWVVYPLFTYYVAREYLIFSTRHYINESGEITDVRAEYDTTDGRT